MTPPIDPAEAVRRMVDLSNADATLVRRGRYLTVDMLLEIGDAAFHLRIRDGRVIAAEAGAGIMRSFAFSIRGGDDAWQAFWQTFPPPHFHDIFALSKTGAFRIEGDLYPLMSNILYFKALLAAPRRPAEVARQ